MKLILAPLATKFIPFPAGDKCLFTVFTHTQITVLFRKHKGKAHLHHDKQGMEISCTFPHIPSAIPSLQPAAHFP